MDIVLPFILVAALVLSTIFKQQPPSPKSVEEQLGEAIGKYLAKGIKIQVEVNNSKE
jgi:hypothetical protein